MFVVIVKIVITTSRSRNAIKRIAAISSDIEVAASDNSKQGFFARYVCDWKDYSTLMTPSLFVAMYIIVWITLFSWRGT